MIVLDLDDTLLDHSRAQRRATQLFGQKYAADIPDYNPQTFQSLWQDCAKHYFLKFVSGELSFEAQACARIRHIFNKGDMPEVQALSIFDAYLLLYQSEWQLFSDVKPFLLTHGKEGVGVLSDGAHAQQWAKLRAIGIADNVRFLITAESTGFAKPDHRFFQKVCDLAGLAPEAVCYIGDHLEKDAKGAQAAGLRGIWLDRLHKTVDAADIPPGVERITTLAEYRPSPAMSE